MTTSPEWKRKIDAAQSLTVYLLKERRLPRVRYGDEADDWGADELPCHDCAVVKGQFHVPECDGEECPNCGGQLLSCDCGIDLNSATS
jgi:hypothetical protein